MSQQKDIPAALKPAAASAPAPVGTIPGAQLHGQVMVALAGASNPFEGVTFGPIEAVELVDDFFVPGELGRTRARYFTTTRKDWPVFNYVLNAVGVVIQCPAGSKKEGAAVVIPWGNIRGIAFLSTKPEEQKPVEGKPQS